MNPPTWNPRNEEETFLPSLPNLMVVATRMTMVTVRKIMVMGSEGDDNDMIMKVRVGKGRVMRMMVEGVDVTGMEMIMMQVMLAMGVMSDGNDVVVMMECWWCFWK